MEKKDEGIDCHYKSEVPHMYNHLVKVYSLPY